MEKIYVKEILEQLCRPAGLLTGVIGTLGENIQCKGFPLEILRINGFCT